ncbi:MAG TPA: DNA-formamidopyrimidine glycosylase family protein [Frankiaceae bacterium]|nr:DNA-formamidopyrimidine glycosylase family protein [Frankiaceae bacterium]
MPEGHTIHRLARDHNAVLRGKALRLSSPQGRFASEAAALDGRVLVRVRPYGKHLFYELGDDVIHVHLGLYGKFETYPQPAPAPVGAVRLRIATDTHVVDLRGPTQCARIRLEERDAVLARLGPDPLDPKADVTAFRRAVARRATPIGVLLLDQTAIAGVGNVFRAEALYLLGIAPQRPASALTAAEADALWGTLVRLMRTGVRLNRIVTTDPADRDRRSGRPSDADRNYLWRRTGLPCRRCGELVRSAELGARTAYWCPGCQPG